MQPIVVACLAFIFSSLCILLFRPLCIRLNHVDKPGGRKRHSVATPLSGGLAIATSVVLLGFGLIPSPAFAGFALGICVLLVLGALDDRKHVVAVVRLTLQTAAVAIGMCLLGDVQLHSIGNLLGTGDIALGSWSVLFTIFAAVGVINAVNMIDGIDGLAGGFAVLLVAVILSLVAGTSAVNSVMLCLVIGSVLGFLAFNLRTPWRRQAKIFLGDAGSLVLGYVLVWFAIEASQGPQAVFEPITAVWLFGLPLCDTVYLMGSRLLRKKSPLAADRYHFHHLLMRHGLTPGWALYAWLLVAGLFMAIGVAGSRWQIPEYVMFVGFLAAFAGYCAFVKLFWRRRCIRRVIRKVRDGRASTMGKRVR